MRRQLGRASAANLFNTALLLLDAATCHEGLRRDLSTDEQKDQVLLDLALAAVSLGSFLLGARRERNWRTFFSRNQASPANLLAIVYGVDAVKAITTCDDDESLAPVGWSAAGIIAALTAYFGINFAGGLVCKVRSLRQA